MVSEYFQPHGLYRGLSPGDLSNPGIDPRFPELQTDSLPAEPQMANHSSTFTWKIPWTEESGRLQAMGSQRVRYDCATSLSFSLSANQRLGPQWRT